MKHDNETYAHTTYSNHKAEVTHSLEVMNKKAYDTNGKKLTTEIPPLPLPDPQQQKSSSRPALRLDFAWPNGKSTDLGLPQALDEHSNKESLPHLRDRATQAQRLQTPLSQNEYRNSCENANHERSFVRASQSRAVRAVV